MKKIMRVEVKYKDEVFKGEVEVLVCNLRVFLEDNLKLKSEDGWYIADIEEVEAYLGGKVFVKLQNGEVIEGKAEFEDIGELEDLDNERMIEEIFYGFF